MANLKANREKEILDKIINKLKCEQCDNYLYPPIVIEQNDNTIICGRCKDDEDDSLTTDTYISNICKLLEFPCFFKKYGCREFCSWKEAEKHEHECPFRQYECPSLETECSWTGTPKDLRKHYGSSHNIFGEESMQVNFYEDSTNYLVEAVGELFVFQIKCDADNDMLWYDVRFLGPPQRAPRFHFKVELYLEDNDLKYIERKQVESYDDDWELDENTAICIRIGMVQNMLKNSDDIYLKLKIDVRVPLYNGKADEALMHEVECPVCKDHMVRPIRMCESGHNFCNNCFHKLTVCPTCRNKFSNVRNLSLESLSEHMQYRCMYFDEGCEFTDIPENIKKHEESCEVSFYECPLKQLFNCKWKGKVGHVCIHAADEHQFKF